MPKNLLRISKSLSIALILVATTAGTVQAADISFLCGSALQSAMEVLIADFQKSTGHTVVASYANVGTITERLRKGEAADLSVTSPEQWAALQKEGKLAADFRLQFAKVGIGIAVKKGAPKPDTTSAAAVKQTLLNARAVAINDPAQGSPAAIHALRIFERLGITTEMKLKTRLAANTDAAFQTVAKGEADLVIANANFIAASVDVEIAGALPEDWLARRGYGLQQHSQLVGPDVDH